MTVTVIPATTTPATTITGYRLAGGTPAPGHGVRIDGAAVPAGGATNTTGSFQVDNLAHGTAHSFTTQVRNVAGWSESITCTRATDTLTAAINSTSATTRALTFQGTKSTRGSASWEVVNNTGNRVGNGTGVSGTVDRLTHNHRHTVNLTVTDGVNQVVATSARTTTALTAHVDGTRFDTNTRALWTTGVGAMTYGPTTQAGVSAHWRVYRHGDRIQVHAQGTGTTIGQQQANRLTHDTPFLVRLEVTDGHNTVASEAGPGTMRTKRLQADLTRVETTTYSVLAQGRALVGGQPATAGLSVDVDLVGVAYRAGAGTSAQRWQNPQYPQLTHGSTWTVKAVVSDGYNRVEATRAANLARIPVPTCTVEHHSLRNPGQVTVHNTTPVFPGGVRPRVIWDPSGVMWMEAASFTFGGIGVGTHEAYADNIDPVGQRAAAPCGVYTVTSGSSNPPGGGGGYGALQCMPHYPDVNVNSALTRSRWIDQHGGRYYTPSPWAPTLTWANNRTYVSVTHRAVNRVTGVRDLTAIIIACGQVGV